MKLTKSGKPDKRFKSSKTFEARDYIFWKKYGYLIAVAIMGFFAGVILTKTLWDINHPKIELSRPLSQTIVPQVEAMEELSWNDAIRQVFPADEAGRMIRICLKENNKPYKWDPVYNKNGSYDFGPCQINSCHKPKVLTNDEWKEYLRDTKNYAKEVRKVYLSQGWNAWVVYSKGYAR